MKRFYILFLIIIITRCPGFSVRYCIYPFFSFLCVRVRKRKRERRQMEVLFDVWQLSRGLIINEVGEYESNSVRRQHPEASHVLTRGIRLWMPAMIWPDGSFLHFPFESSAETYIFYLRDIHKCRFAGNYVMRTKYALSVVPGEVVFF